MADEPSWDDYMDDGEDDDETYEGPDAEVEEDDVEDMELRIEDAAERGAGGATVGDILGGELG